MKKNEKKKRRKNGKIIINLNNTTPVWTLFDFIKQSGGREDERVDGWMDGWKAILRIAFSNQKKRGDAILFELAVQFIDNVKDQYFS